MTEKPCPHGQLSRQCPLCELEKENAELKELLCEAQGSMLTGSPRLYNLHHRIRQAIGDKR